VQFQAVFEITLDIFDGHSGVIHQDADRQRQSAERHDVDGLVQETEADDGPQNRERNGNGDDRCVGARCGHNVSSPGL
jgi:hypothetical protein